MRLDRHLAPLALGILVFLILAVGAAEWLNDRTLPKPFRFVVPNASGYLVTGPLRDLWRNGPSHFSLVFSAPQSKDAVDGTTSIKSQLARSCFGIDDFAELSRFGIDDRRGSAITVVDSQGVLVSVPVADQSRFEAFAERMLGSEVLTLSPFRPDDDPPPAATPKVSAIRIDANESKGVITCSDSQRSVPLAAGSVIPADQDPTQEANPAGGVTLYVSPSSRDAEVRVKCTTLFADGTRGDCHCSINVLNDDCSSKPQALALGAMQATLQGRMAEGLKIGDRFLFFAGEDTALLATRLDIVEAAVLTGDNFDYFRGDDGLLKTLSHLLRVGGEGDGILTGAFAAPYLPVTGRIHLALAVGSQRIAVRALIPWQSLESTLLERLASPSSIKQTAGSLPSDADLTIDDPWLGYYVQFLERNSERARKLLQGLGSFLGFIEEVADSGPIHLALRGVRDGVPDAIMSIDLPHDAAEALLLKQRIKMRTTRDREILTAALQKYRMEMGFFTDDIADLAPYLKDEATVLADRYMVVDDDAEAAGETPTNVPDWGMTFKLKPDAMRADTFMSSDYSVSYDGLLLEYVPPGINDLDLAYRLNSKAGKRINVDALKAGTFRTVAYIDNANHRLLLGSTTQALAAFLDASSSPAGPARSAAPPGRKASLTGNPQYLIDQGILYPDEQVKGFVDRHLRDFAQYHRLDAFVEPLPDLQGISATVVVSHD